MDIERLKSPRSICLIKSGHSANIAAKIGRVSREAGVSDFAAWRYRLERTRGENCGIGLVEVRGGVALGGRFNALRRNAGVNQVDLGRFDCGKDSWVVGQVRLHRYIVRAYVAERFGVDRKFTRGSVVLHGI